MAPKADKASVPATTNKDYSELSFTELQALISGGEVAHIQEIDDVVRIEKESLIDRPFVITGWSYNPDGDMGDFVVVQLTTMDNKHGFFSDGSTGIKDQLLAAENKMGSRKPIYLPKGLRVSSYMYLDPTDSKSKPAQTFYLNNAE